MTIREHARAWLCFGYGLLAFAFAPRAQARGLAGAAEVQLRTTAFQYSNYQNSAKLVSVTPGVPQPALSPSTRTSTEFGLLGSGYGAEVGYFVSEHFQLGAGVLFSHDNSSEDGAGSSSSTGFSLLPRVEYCLGGARVTPYVAAFGGYRRSWSSSSSLGLVDSKIDNSGYQLGAGVGAHVFVADSWSLDPELTLARFGQNGTQTSTGSTDTGPVRYAYDDTVRGTTVALSIGLSGWFGGH